MTRQLSFSLRSLAHCWSGTGRDPLVNSDSVGLKAEMTAKTTHQDCNAWINPRLVIDMSEAGVLREAKFVTIAEGCNDV